MSASSAVRQQTGLAVPKLPEQTITHVQFAATVLADRRSAVSLTVEQIREMAAAILVLDHELIESRQREIAMLSAPPPKAPEPETRPAPKPEPAPDQKTVLVAVMKDEPKHFNHALLKLVETRERLRREYHGPDENMARQKFEKAAIALADIVTEREGR